MFKNTHIIKIIDEIIDLFHQQKYSKTICNNWPSWHKLVVWEFGCKFAVGAFGTIVSSVF